MRGRGASRAAWVAVFAATLACRRGAPPAVPSVEPGLARYLPSSVPGYEGGPLTVGEGFVRRDYAQKGVTIDVTVVQRAMGAEQYEGWVQQSRDYPQVALEVPEGSANGFFSCAGSDPGSACDLHVQFKAGFHLEVLGEGRASRSQLEDLVRRLPVRALASASNP